MRRKTKIERADIAIAEAAAPMRHTPPVQALGWLSEIADQPQLISLCAATLLVGLATRDARLARAGGRMLAAELLATKLKSTVKHRIDRTRPRVSDDGGDYALELGHDHATELNSFPSGHTAGAVAVARAFAREYPEQRDAAYAAAALIAAIQIPRCQHYATDLAAGALVGLAAEVAVDATMGFVRVPPPQPVRPELVEGLSYLPGQEREGFDKLSPNGLD